MNEKAEELGLTNTHFVTPHGLDEEQHYTTAHELAILTDYALNNKKFASIVNTKTCEIQINGQSQTISNTNELLGNLNGVNGVKTGFTNGAGRCLVTSTLRNGHQIICVVLGADTKKIRTEDSIKLIEYAFSNYQYINAKKKIEERFKTWQLQEASSIRYDKARTKNVSYYLEENDITWIPILKGKEKEIEVCINYNNNTEAPLKKDEVIGSIEIKIGDEVLLHTNILLKEEVAKKNIVDYLKEFVANHSNYLVKTMQEIVQK